MRQREMALLAELVQARYVDADVVASWASYRDAVVWCWNNQRLRIGMKEPRRQLLFAEASGVHPPHMSRCVKPNSRAPMNLDPNVVPEFEAFTGWRGVSQWQARNGSQTLMEQVIQERAAA